MTDAVAAAKWVHDFITALDWGSTALIITCCIVRLHLNTGPTVIVKETSRL